MRTIVVLMDTFRRDNLKIYNPQSNVITPNLDDFAKDSLTFDQHWVGSAPCMPARRDLFTGRLNFVERSWGPIEPFDVTLQKTLKDHGIFTHITTDHTHYLRLGGEGYIQEFDSWHFERGQEGDPYVSRIDKPNMPESFYGRLREQHEKNKTKWSKPEEYPSPKTFLSAVDWIEDNKGHEDFFLMVECFDPHEPFDVADEYMDLYDKVDMDVEYYDTPNYGKVDTPEAGTKHLNTRYKALTTMNDEFFGKFIQSLKDNDMYDDTMIIVTTDHGFFFGEHDYIGKNIMHMYNELSHLPLMVKFANSERAGERVSTLTQNIDVMPTILEAFKLEIPEDVRGKSWMPLVENKEIDRDSLIFGYHGMAMNVTDGNYTYFRGPNASNTPLYEYYAIPTTIRGYLGEGAEDKIEFGNFIKRSKFPVMRVPVSKPRQILAFDQGIDYVRENMLFDIENDYHQQNNLAGKETEIEMAMLEKMKQNLKEHDAPIEQYERLGLKTE